MATPTPGVLLKLLQSMKSLFDHPSYSTEPLRPSVLQLTGIAPSTSELWPSSDGFYIQLSDSLNSTYVSCSGCDDADPIQLGQMVHVDRLLPSHPVPRVLNLRPLPFLGRSPPPILGSPSPLSVLSSPSDPSSFVIQPSAPPLVPATMAAAPTAAKVAGLTAAAATAAPKRRFSSPGAAKRRDPSPSVGTGSGSRSSSPVPSKCSVPGLVAAKEEGRKTAREAAIIVPSRYRQPSPVGGGRRGSTSPMVGRRLSGGMKGCSPGTEKKKAGVAAAGIARVSGGLAGKAAAARKSWEENSGEKEKVKSGNDGQVVDPKAILKTQVAVSSREQSNTEEEDTPRFEKPKSVKKTESSPKEKANNAATKITVHDRKWTDGSIPFDAVSEHLERLGKEALQRRNIASIAAAEALEEALAAESVIRCLSMFSDLCLSSKAGNPLPTIDRFLAIYEDAMKWISISESLASARNMNMHHESIPVDKTKPSFLWVDAALATDLEVVSLLSNLEGHSKDKLSAKTAVPIMDPTPRTSFSKKNSQAKVSANVWSRGHCVSETVNFAKYLRGEMQNWFMKFVEDALDVGFRLFGELEVPSCKDNGRVAAVLSQLKRVNDWLDSVGKKKEEEVILVEKIERLKRKIYGFVITHVGSAFDSAVSLSKVG